MLVDTGDTVGCVIAVSGVWEPHITAVARRLLSSGDVFIDVGAHIGYYTLVASRIVGPEGHVYAFEPAPETYAALRENLARNGVSNVTALRLAAGSRYTTATLLEAPRANTSASTLVPRAALESSAGVGHGRTEVSVSPVHTQIQPEHVARVRMVKVDVEGSEIDALRGLERLLGGSSPLALLVEISPEWSDESPAAYLDRLCREHGLVPWRVRNDYSLDAYYPSVVEPPVRIDAIPRERADLILVRGFDLGAEA